MFVFTARSFICDPESSNVPLSFIQPATSLGDLDLVSTRDTRSLSEIRNRLTFSQEEGGKKPTDHSDHTFDDEDPSPTFRILAISD